MGALKVIGNVTIRYSAYDFLFDFNRNHASIFYRFRVKPVIRRKSSILTHPTCILVPPKGVTPVARSNFAEIFGFRKLQSLGYRVVLFVWRYV